MYKRFDAVWLIWWSVIWLSGSHNSYSLFSYLKQCGIVLPPSAYMKISFRQLCRGLLDLSFIPNFSDWKAGYIWIWHRITAGLSLVERGLFITCRWLLVTCRYKSWIPYSISPIYYVKLLSWNILVNRRSSGTIGVHVYWKPTHLDRYRHKD